MTEMTFQKWCIYGTSDKVGGGHEGFLSRFC